LMRRDLVEKESIQDMLRREKGIQYAQLTQEELERNKELTESELERLEKERIIEDLNIAKHVSDQANLEREEKIRLLTQEKSLQDLALSKKELLISRQATTRNSLIIGSVALIIVSLLFYNRYRNQKKSHLALDKAYTELSETHQKLINTQEQLVHAQKMASLGELTAGIAHEIQNPLNFVNNFSDISLELISDLKESGPNQEAVLKDLATNLEKINTHGKRADKIVKGMLLHSRSGSTEKQPVNLNATIDELLELSYHGSRKRENPLEVSIIRAFDSSLPDVNVVINSISRVLVNLFNNSLYAIESKAKNGALNYSPVLKVSTQFVNNTAIVTIRDNGTGIPKTILSKIFDPFFTTKPAGQGTGLGLSLSYDIIVNGHNGSVSVNSEENVFTEFVISLPVNIS
ncbi:MAG TPA: ATP-binding protein, partial [Bacteroidia bacterium]|nr:ATP-binding protein [Bacteroidia bacterium]